MKRTRKPVERYAPPDERVEREGTEGGDGDDDEEESEGAARKRRAASSTARKELKGRQSYRPEGYRRPPTSAEVEEEKQPLPGRDGRGRLCFADHPEFKPNLSPKEVMQLGSFGGTYFRPITSGVTGETYRDAWREFPEDWFEGLDVRRQVASATYRPDVNKYSVKCGADLDQWESSGWINAVDPYGWFMWYCRFYLGRRTSDDERQLKRGLGVMGPKGRWRSTLYNKMLNSGRAAEDALEDLNISPVIRQTLQHWGYRPNLADLKEHAKRVGRRV
mmetsp:Transcript_11676/g.39465  ORF Transcript_11676/g.39465 Transcript_11676/m.39465 type:complete len:276 (-) Transcript_11676:108-935(-)